MTRTSTPVRQGDLTRYLRAALAAGLEINEVYVAPDGSVRIIASGKDSEIGFNPCDRLLEQ